MDGGKAGSGKAGEGGREREGDEREGDEREGDERAGEGHHTADLERGLPVFFPATHWVLGGPVRLEKGKQTARGHKWLHEETDH